MNYSNCKWCGSRLKERATKCENCGHAVEQELRQTRFTPKPPQTPAPSRPRAPAASSGGLRRFIRLIVIGGALYYAWPYIPYILNRLQEFNSRTGEQPPAQPVPEQGTTAVQEIPTDSLKSSDPQVRSAACESLGKMKPLTPEIVQALAEMLKDPDPNVRGMCIYQVGEFGVYGTGFIPELIENLKHESMYIRMAAADSLGDVASEISDETRVVAPLSAAMDDSEELVRRSACWSLKKLGPRMESASSAFQKGTKDSSIDVRKCSVAALGQIGQASLDITHLVKALSDRDPEIRITAAEALAESGPAARKAIPNLAALINDPDAYVRTPVAEALGKCCQDTGETVPLLIKILDDPDHSVRKIAVLYLGGMGKKAAPAVPGLIKILSGEEIYLRVWSAEALGNIGPDARAALPRLREMRNEKIVSYESEVSQLPSAVEEAIQKIEAP